MNINDNIDELLSSYGQEYLSETGDYEYSICDMEELEYFLQDNDLEWLLNRMYFGGIWRRGEYNSNDTFNPNDPWFVINAYYNFFSLSEYDYDDYVKTKVEERGIDEFIQWCSEQGYIEE